MSRPNKNTNLFAKNVSGTSSTRFSGSASKSINGIRVQSWLAVAKSTGSQRTQCARLGCGRTDVVGAHVRTVDRRSPRNIYVTPLCTKDNNASNRAPMPLKQNAQLVALVPKNGNREVLKK